ncbi:MAG: aldehyde dehydrogenase family protein [Hyphomonadaceae bacterium]
MAMLVSHSPIDGAELGAVSEDGPAEIEAKIAAAQAAFLAWRAVPAPKRGELVRIWGDILRRRKDALGLLVTRESGKILSEGLGEVQEMIDICDFAVGLSRQLYGLTIASERAAHHLNERWHPLGVVGIITAFNFPVAVFAWNAALALVCGNSVIWKPSEKTPLCAAAVMESLEEAMAQFGDAPTGLLSVIQGGAAAGAALARDERVALLSATGSTRMGKAIAADAAKTLKRTLLELGGNAAMIVRASADLDIAVRAICFSAVGTAGQRCTSLRRLILAPEIADDLVARLKRAYASLPVGDPTQAGVLVGPLIDEAAFKGMEAALAQARADGGVVHGGGRVGDGPGFYARPALVEMRVQTEIVRTETFAPILYVLRAAAMEEAIALLRDVPQGLSSAIFTNDMREAELFLSALGSDCGIANVNAGPSGAEIGGAFGGEKETGGGRESGSDSWRAYMRRQTQTVNFGTSLPLAQGVSFDLD